MKPTQTNPPLLSKILFLDIETVSGAKSYESLDQRTQDLWSKKAKQIKKRSSECEEMTNSEIYTEKAGIFAEFGKIIVISVGMIRRDGSMHLSSYSGHDEKQILTDFGKMLDEHYCDPKCFLCGHNAKEFDIPYLCRRALVHGLTLPKIMPHHTDKPWDTQILDTMEMRKFGDRKNYTSLDILCNIFNIESPKCDINGSDVTKVYRNDGDLSRIEEYCENDVRALIAVYKKLAL